MLLTTMIDEGIAVDTGSDASGGWRTPTGMWINQNATNKVLSCDIDVAWDPVPTQQGGIVKVVFGVSLNGGGETFYTVTSETLRQPNYTQADSWLPYSPRHGPSPIWAYGIDVDLVAVGGGTVAVSCVIHAKSGATTALADLVIYNDTDGVDRRPCKAEIYVSTATGTSGGAGTLGDPVDDIQEAIDRCRAVSGSSDVGGGRIYTLDDTVSMGGRAATGWMTSGSWHLHIEAIGQARGYARSTEGVFDPVDSLYGAGGSGSQDSRIEFVGFDVLGYGFVMENSAGLIAVRFIGCTHSSKYWNASQTKPHVNYAADSDHLFAVNGGDAEVDAWNFLSRGRTFGLAGYNNIHDFVITKCLGVALQTNDAQFHFSHGLIEGIRYKPGEIDGYSDTGYGFVVKGGVHLTVSAPSEGVMRIEATDSTPPDFADEFAGIVADGVGYWGVECSLFTSGGNNGTFPITAAGHTAAGLPWIECTNGSAVPEVGSATARIQTGKIGGSAYNVIIHTDGWQAQTAVTNAMLSNIRMKDCRNTRSFVGAGFSMTGLVMKNLCDGSPPSPDHLELDFAGCAVMEECLIINCTFGSPGISFAAGASYTYTAVIDSVFGNGPADFPDQFVRGCHFIAGTAYGVGATSGPWFNTDPSVEPFDASPSPSNQRFSVGWNTNHDYWTLSGRRPVMADWLRDAP